MAIWPCQLPRTMLQCSKYVCGETSKPRALGWLLNGLSPLERQEMPSEQPYAGQLWKRDSTHVLVVTAYQQALPIVKHLDVLEHRGPRLRAGAEPGLMNALRLERGEEALHGRIIQAIAASAHRLLDAMPLQHRPIRPSGVLRSAVAVMNEP